ncbi:MAG: DNA sulfur modification protein DndD [Methylotenera sp.]
MIIEKFVINNLFSYHGVCEFDLSPPENSDKNVALIWGRNGFGKTSFINSLKLLLSGVTNDLRKSIQVGRTPSREQFLLGLGDEWMGIFNNQARLLGELDYSVSASWREPSGTVFVKRIWNLSKEGVHEELRIEPSFGDHLIDKDNDPEGEARAFLQARIPDAVLPFFVYDGEKVQQLAEANRDEQLQQIEKLLDLSNIDEIREYLGRNLSKWRSLSKDTNQHALNALNLQVQTKEQQLAQLNHEKASIQEEIQEMDYSLKRLDTAIQARRQFALQSEEAALSAKRQAKSDTLQEKTTTFFESFTRDAPLVLFPAVMGMAAAELEKLTNHPNRRLKDEMERVFSSLPQRLLLDPPHPVPHLAYEQLDFLQRKLNRVLESYRPDPVDAMAGLFYLRADRAEAVLRVVEDYANNTKTRQEWAKQLSEIRQLKRDLNEIERKLNDVSNLAPQEVEAFQQRLNEKSAFEQKRLQLEGRLGELREQEKQLSNELEKQKTDYRFEEKKLVGARQAEGKLGLGKKVSDVLDAYRALLKTRRREEIELAINKRFKELMTSNTLIQKIQVEEDFSLHFFDLNNSVIGMANISAGMKQLVAQSLLWGLKDVSQKEAPIVVDTPLARIDRQHQENLITRYYPKASAQVIVLPTDAELDREKYALLKPYVYREYCLNNPTGDRTQVNEGSYYHG